MKTKTEVVAFKPSGHVGQIFFTIPDGEDGYDYGYLKTMLDALKKRGIVLEDDDEERNVGIVSKKTANNLAGVKLAGSKTVYTDYVLEYQSTAKDIPATLKKIAAELPAPAEVVLL